MGIQRTSLGLVIGLALLRLETSSLSGEIITSISCDVCGKAITSTIYTIEDRVTKTKKGVCWTCEYSLPRCFLCGLPALTNAPGAVQFEDERTLCARDAKTAVLREEEGLRIFTEVREQLERQFSRFISLPQTNVSFATIDRLHLENLFKIVGHDYDCPNVFGLTMTKTNAGRLEYEISVLLGLPRGGFQATCAHECAHIWQGENLSEERQKALSQAAREGFCELMAFLFVDALHDEAAKSQIMANAYTRGQVALFVEAEKSYGLNDIIDWMKYGADDRLKANELQRVRTIEAPSQPKQPVPVSAAIWTPEPVRTYDTLALKAIFWDARRPTALVNERTLAPGEETTLRISGTNLAVRCLEIQQDAVRIRIVATGEEKELLLGHRN
jgi:hypothetical protein